ncbi:MAG: GNAT family N-acetyltransferase [Planctomycetes bacterium]|nr:GNAT family N-acetyltransferase [Planctomycetota bacterium]
MATHLFVSTEKALLDLDAIYGFLSTCYWSPGIARSRLERAIANSMCFGVYERAGQGLQSRQVGFARVVTDKATYAYLCDVFVLEGARGRGAGKLLMRTILDHPEIQGLRRFCLMTRDAHGLYAQFGFAPMPDPSRYMEVTDRESYKRD